MLDPSRKTPDMELAPGALTIPGRFLTISQAAKLLGISTGTLRNWDRSGKLRAHRNPLTAYRLYDPRELEGMGKRGLAGPRH